MLALRKKASPAIPPNTPSASEPTPVEENSTRAMAAGPALGRAGITPPTKWTEMTGKVTEPSSPQRAEDLANDAPTFPPIKADAFDEVGCIKPEFMIRFMRAPWLHRKKGTTVRDDEPDETKAYDTFDVIEILEDQQHYLAESFEAGITLLREHYQVINFLMALNFA